MSTYPLYLISDRPTYRERLRRRWLRREKPPDIELTYRSLALERSAFPTTRMQRKQLGSDELLQWGNDYSKILLTVEPFIIRSHL